MRVIAARLPWMLWAVAAFLISAPARSDGMEFAGHGYVSLSSWARIQNFTLTWVRRNDILLMTNRVARLVFTRDSRDIEVDGVTVCLSYPVMVHDGAAFVSQTDFDTAIRPLLFPPRNRTGSRVRNIVIDPGHGGKDPGNLDGSHQEKKYTLLLAEELADQLRHAGFNCSLTRANDTFISLSSRPETARVRGADLFISLHWNTVPSAKNEVRGAQTFCVTPVGASSSNAGGEVIGAGPKTGNRHDAENILLAYEIQKFLVKRVGIVDRGVRRARYMVLCDAEMPAVLIEGGFMSHPAESRQIYDPVYRRQMAQAIVRGVEAYKQDVER